MRNLLLLLLTGQATVVGGWLCVAVVTGKYWILVIVYRNSLCDWSTETRHPDKCFCTVSQQRQLVNEAIICCVRNNICMLLDISKDVCSVHMSRTIFHIFQTIRQFFFSSPNLTKRGGWGGKGRGGEFFSEAVCYLSYLSRLCLSVTREGEVMNSEGRGLPWLMLEGAKLP